MCSVSEIENDLSVVNAKIDELDLSDEENCEDAKNTNLVISGASLCQLDEVLAEKFGVSKSKITQHRQELIEAAALYFNEAPSTPPKIADTITVDNCETVHVGHVFNITENIVLNSETNELEINNGPYPKDYTNHFHMVDRLHWLAQPSVAEKIYLKEPAKFVIIGHTATEEVYTQAENVLMLRLLQTFHITSQGWADIAYNFCIGSDGNAYEGRGWSLQGAHTLLYNRFSIGIAFIGCFLNHLPPESALMVCKNLIAHGVAIGAISENYELLGHCQCRGSESPGKRLFEEISTWKNFNPNISVTNPSPLLQK